jgi:hypothetical protein
MEGYPDTQFREFREGASPENRDMYLRIRRLGIARDGAMIGLP